ncbi:MAG: hypothetical protein JST92_25515, partial [Deltaproteobacteria bacterium]|nr:hypothetical protein [Deltaproteobacteria bacterium]
MAVFRDESGRRGRAVQLATTLGAIVAVAAVATFALSVAPIQWRAQVEPVEATPAHKVSPPGKPGDAKAREVAFRKEDARLKGLIAAAQAAQKRRPADDKAQQVLAAFVVNWDTASLASLQAHAGALTHVMP